jgi:hypothetical protein
MPNTRYKISIIEFTGEGEAMTAQPRYEQTVDTVDVRKVIAAVNAEDPRRIEPILPSRKRAPRSDKGVSRKTKVLDHA